MRLWSLHPQYLDSQGLVALWRETLLARAALNGDTQGYRRHPQLERFRFHASPMSAIGSYLEAIYIESVSRGYSFDQSKVGHVEIPAPIAVTTSQVEYEWHHLLSKLSVRNPTLYARWREIVIPECHPLFQRHPGPIEPWERRRTHSNNMLQS